MLQTKVWQTDGCSYEKYIMKLFLWSFFDLLYPHIYHFYLFVNPTQFLTPQWQNKPYTNTNTNLPMYLAYVPSDGQSGDYMLSLRRA